MGSTNYPPSEHQCKNLCIQYIYIPGGGAVNAHPRKFVNIFYEMWMGVWDNKAANLETSSTIEQHVKHYV